MARYLTTIRSPRPAVEAFDYLADLRNFAEWDPGVRRVRQVEGDGAGPGSVVDVSVAGVGRDLTLRYRTEAYRPPHTVVVRAHNLWFTSLDRVTVEDDPMGCIVTYDAELSLNGVLALGDPVLRVTFRRIADRAADGLRLALDGETLE